jgi:Zn-dependent protease
MQFDFFRLVLSMAAIIPAITLHEFCHAKFADLGGDDTPRLQGRVTLNPLAHLDPLGTLMMIISSLSGFGIGWGRPVMVNTSKLKNRRVDNFILTIAGPLSNLFLALLWAIILRFALMPIESTEVLIRILKIYALVSVEINVSLFIFNLVPIGPLDGHWLVSELLPEKQRLAWLQFCHGPGMWIFLILVLIPSNSPYDILGKTIYPIAKWIIGNLLGIPIE